MYRVRREKKKEFLFLRGSIHKLGSIQCFLTSWSCFLFTFFKLTFGAGSTPTSPWLGYAPWVASLLNICSGLDTISDLCAPVTYMRPKLCNSLIDLCWIFVNCKVVRARFSSVLSNCNCHQVQWESQWVLSTAQEILSSLQSCVLVITIIVRH